MHSHFLPYLRFHLSRLKLAHPVALPLLGFCVLATAVTVVLFLIQWQRLSEARETLSQLRATATSAQILKANEPVVTLAPPELPPFHSALLVTALHDAAGQTGLSLDEVNYALDANSAQPYLRYRFTMRASAAYPLIRRFLEQLQADVPHLTLDAIDCSREDITVVLLRCDMVMSGFFEKRQHG